MKIALTVLIATLGFSAFAQADYEHDIGENIAYSCGSILVLSENETYLTHMSINGRAGELSTSTSSVVVSQSGVRTMKMNSEPSPLERTQKLGWIDGLLGIYENNDYVLTISGRKEGEASIYVKASNETIACSIYGYGA